MRIQAFPLHDVVCGRSGCGEPAYCQILLSPEAMGEIDDILADCERVEVEGHVVSILLGACADCARSLLEGVPRSKTIILDPELGELTKPN